MDQEQFGNLFKISTDSSARSVSFEYSKPRVQLVKLVRHCRDLRAELFWTWNKLTGFGAGENDLSCSLRRLNPAVLWETRDLHYHVIWSF
jgi:hypothetical protein